MWYKWRGKPHKEHAACEVCGLCPFTGYMVKDELWPKPYHFLCLACFVSKLGRMVELNDFKPCQWTNHLLLGVALSQKKEIDLTGF